MRSETDKFTFISNIKSTPEQLLKRKGTLTFNLFVSELFFLADPQYAPKLRSQSVLVGKCPDENNKLCVYCGFLP